MSESVFALASKRTNRFNKKITSFVCTVVLFFFTAGWAAAADVTLVLNAVDASQQLSGFRVYYKTGSPGSPYSGTGIDQGPSPVDIPIGAISDPLNAEIKLTGLQDGTNYYFAATAYDSNGNESVYSNEELLATPAPVIHNITATSSGNGSIAPSGSLSVVEGGTATYTFSATAFNHIDDVAVDGQSIGVVGSYTFDNIGTDHTIAVVFKPDTFTVTANAGTGGIISPSYASTVSYGQSLSYAITPDPGYYLASITVDGHPEATGSTYTFSNIDADHSIVASFAVIQSTGLPGSGSSPVTGTAGQNNGNDMNIAPLAAAISVSSENAVTSQLAVKAADECIEGWSSGDYTCEWATRGEGSGAWISLDWDAAYRVSQVVLYDRPNSNDNIQSATLSFSDGSTVAVGALDNDGSPVSITFPEKTITGMTLTVDGVSSNTGNVGLAEIEVFGDVAYTNNIAPLATTVSASSESVATSQLDVKVVDECLEGWSNGDYTCEWATHGEGSGAWLRLDWDAAYRVDKVVLYDRPNSNDNIQSATLSFSDGSTLAVGALNNDGTPVSITFPEKIVTGMTLTVDTVSGTTRNVGLAEIEVFGDTAYPDNIAPWAATVSASSENVATSQLNIRAVDECLEGWSNGDYTCEWAARSEGAGAWIHLDWNAAYRIGKVVLYDRPNSSDNIQSATLSFSDGSTVAVGALNNDGTPVSITFPEKIVTGMTLTVDTVSNTTHNVGLAEIEVFGGLQ